MSIARMRLWYVEQAERGEIMAIPARIAAGETLDEVLATLPIAVGGLVLIYGARRVDREPRGLLAVDGDAGSA